MRDRRRAARRIAVAVGAWIVVVVSGSWLVWTVIAAAGSSFVGTAGSVPVKPESVAPSPQRSPTRTATTATTATTQPTQPTQPSSTARVTSSVPTPVTVRSRSWSGAPGIVTVRCTGARIELGGAVVTATGYSVEVGRRGPAVVVVEFHRRADAGDIRVAARCRGGSPEFSVATDD